MAAIISKKRMQVIIDCIIDLESYIHDMKILIEAITFAAGKNNCDLDDAMIYWDARRYAMHDLDQIRKMLKIK